MPGPQRDRVVSDSVLHGTVLIANFKVQKKKTEKLEKSVEKMSKKKPVCRFFLSLT